MCPVECCVPNPDIVESEGALLSKAAKLHPDQTFPASDALDGDTSHFRNDGWINKGR